jgi:hypothetical protein
VGPVRMLTGMSGLLSSTSPLSAMAGDGFGGAVPNPAPHPEQRPRHRVGSFALISFLLQISTMKPRSAAAISVIGWFISALLFGFLLLSSWGLFEH